MRQIHFSKQMLHNQHFNYTKNMNIVPFHDEKGQIKGTQIIWPQRKKDKPKQDLKTINMFDQEINNIYKYKSEIIYGGVKRELISSDSL